jgi:polyisoprenoid-binding protein YceI
LGDRRSHSSVEFAVKHMMFTTVKGRFAGVEGTIKADEGNPTDSAVKVTIDVASIDTRDEKRDGHLKSPDFFDAATFPAITFESTRVEPQGDNAFLVHASSPSAT